MSGTEYLRCCHSLDLTPGSAVTTANPVPQHTTCEANHDPRKQGEQGGVFKRGHMRQLVVLHIVLHTPPLPCVTAYNTPGPYQSVAFTFRRNFALPKYLVYNKNNLGRKIPATQPSAGWPPQFSIRTILKSHSPGGPIYSRRVETAS